MWALSKLRERERERERGVCVCACVGRMWKDSRINYTSPVPAKKCGKLFALSNK